MPRQWRHRELCGGAWPAPLICLAVWAGLVAVYVLAFRPAFGGPGLCMVRNLTGMPCPTCGMTRAALALGSGDFSQAAGHSPLLMATMGLGLAWLIATPFHRSPMRLPRWTWIVVVSLLLGNWLYLVAVQ